MFLGFLISLNIVDNQVCPSVRKIMEKSCDFCFVFVRKFLSSCFDQIGARFLVKIGLSECVMIGFDGRSSCDSFFFCDSKGQQCLIYRFGGFHANREAFSGYLNFPETKTRKHFKIRKQLRFSAKFRKPGNHFVSGNHLYTVNVFFSVNTCLP